MSLISPYLFSLCMDKFSHVISETTEDGKYEGMKAGRKGPIISHLMYPDDLLLFGSASKCQMICVMKNLDKLYDSLG